MSGHLSESDFIDALETGEGPWREHLSACAGCAATLAGLRQADGAASEAPVPEPPPLFWEAQRARIRMEALAAPAGRPRWWLAPVAALAAAAALVVVMPSHPAAPVAVPAGPLVPAWSALPAPEDDPGLVVLEGVAADGQNLAAGEDCSDLTECVAGMDDRESAALAALLRSELPKEGRS